MCQALASKYGVHEDTRQLADIIITFQLAEIDYKVKLDALQVLLNPSPEFFKFLA